MKRKAPIFVPPRKMLTAEDSDSKRPRLDNIIDDDKPVFVDKKLDEKVEHGMKAAKNDILMAMKKTETMLVPFSDRPGGKEHFLLKPSKPAQMRLKQFIREYAQIDVQGKSEPMIVRIHGISSHNEHFQVLLSTGDKFPDESNTKICYKNQGKFEFYIQGQPKEQKEEGSDANADAMRTTGSKFDKSEIVKFAIPHVYLAFESSLEADIRVSVVFGQE